MDISDWSSDVCSSDLRVGCRLTRRSSRNRYAVRLTSALYVTAFLPSRGDSSFASRALQWHSRNVAGRASFSRCRSAARGNSVRISVTYHQTNFGSWSTAPDVQPGAHAGRSRPARSVHFPSFISWAETPDPNSVV